MSNALTRKIRSDKQLQKYVEKKKVEMMPSLIDEAFNQLEEKIKKGNDIFLDKLLTGAGVLRDKPPQVAVQINNTVNASRGSGRGIESIIRLLENRDAARSVQQVQDAQIIDAD